MKKERKEYTRQLFIDAAKSIIESDGIDHVSARRIGELSGFSYATIYNYFKDINTLLTYVAIDYLEDSYQYTIKNESTWKTTLNGIIQLARGYYTYMIEHPSIFKMIFINDFGDVPASVAKDLVPKVTIKMHELLSKLDQSKFKLDYKYVYEFLTASMHAKIMMQVFQRGNTTVSEDLLAIENEIKEITGNNETKMD